MVSRFSIFPLFLFALILFPSPKPAIADSPPPSGSICSSELETGIDRILQREEFTRSYWGILIQPLHSNQSLYRLNENKFFIPASNAKLLTTAAALQVFPPDYRIKTPILAQGNAPNLETLTVVGKGDPSLTTGKLEILARQLKDSGIRQIDRLQVDDSFWTRSINKSWEWEDIFFYYAVPPSSVTLNENAVTLEVFPTRPGQAIALKWSDNLAARQWSIENRTTTAPAGTPNTLEIRGNLGDSRLILTGSLAIDAKDDFSIAIPDPSRYFLDRLREILENAGITVKTTEITAELMGAEINAIESVPISQIVQKVNTESHNFFAETLLQLIGGTEGLKERLSRLGVNRNDYSLQDGSGLSRQNLITPSTLVRVLQLLANDRTYRDSLAIGGVSGTLAERFKNTPVQGQVRAKTGTLSGVVALSGYLDNPNYDSIAFSILVNHSDRPAGITRNGIDEIILLLGRLKRC